MSDHSRFDLATATQDRFEDWMLFHHRHENELSVEFLVFKVLYDDPDTGQPQFEKIDDTVCGIPTPDPSEAQVFMSGSVKWDGCSNWWFDEQDTGVMIHFCGRDAATAVGRVMHKMYDLAAARMPKFDWKCAGMEPPRAALTAEESEEATRQGKIVLAMESDGRRIMEDLTLTALQGAYRNLYRDWKRLREREK
jgi:hypothetical protein